MESDTGSLMPAEAAFLDNLSVSPGELERKLAEFTTAAVVASGECPSASELLHPEDLSDDEAVLLERHLDVCPRCAAVVLAAAAPVALAALDMKLAANLIDGRSAEFESSAALRPAESHASPALRSKPPCQTVSTQQRRDRVRQQPKSRNAQRRRTSAERVARYSGRAVAATIGLLVACIWWSARRPSVNGPEHVVADASHDADVKPAARPDADRSREQEVAIARAELQQSVWGQRWVESKNAPGMELPLGQTASQEYIKLASLLAMQHAQDDKALRVALASADREGSAPGLYTANVLEVLVPYFLQQNQPERAEKLLRGIVEKPPTDPNQAQKLLPMFELVYGPDQLNKPAELAAVREKLAALQSP